MLPAYQIRGLSEEIMRIIFAFFAEKEFWKLSLAI